MILHTQDDPVAFRHSFPVASELCDPTRVLYISYDGLLEPLGQSQILPYLVRLSTRPIKIFLVTFEKGNLTEPKGERETFRQRLWQQGIRWIPLRYHKTPKIPATLYDILVGVALGVIIARRQKIAIVHARSYVPALIALVLKQITGVKFLFDMRGFWADERVDGRVWRSGGTLYRVAKALEKIYLSKADAIITLTDAARNEIEALEYLQGRRPHITVIPTCVDLDQFEIREQRSGPLRDSGVEERFTLVYSGSLGTWYALDAMTAFFLVLKKYIPNASFLILTQSPRQVVETVRNKYALSEKDMNVQNVPYQRMPESIASGDAGIIFSRPSWANKARCPTKLAEFLASGVPVVMSRGIGDTEALIQRERVGVVVEEFTESAYEKALGALRDLLSEGDLKGRCRQVAERYFSLQEGVTRYQRVYRQLTDGALSPRASGYSS